MLILVLCSEPATLPGRCCWLILQRSVKEECNYKLLDIVLEVPSSKRQEQVTGNRINPVKVKSNLKRCQAPWVSASSSSSRECSAPCRLELAYFLPLAI